MMSVATLSQVENKHYHGKNELNQKFWNEIIRNRKRNFNSIQLNLVSNKLLKGLN